MRLAVFILQDALSVWTNLGKHSLFVWLFVSSVKTNNQTNNECLPKFIQTHNASSSIKTANGRFYTRGRIMRLDELSFISQNVPWLDGTDM